MVSNSDDPTQVGASLGKGATRSVRRPSSSTYAGLSVSGPETASKWEREGLNFELSCTQASQQLQFPRKTSKSSPLGLPDEC